MLVNISVFNEGLFEPWKNNSSHEFKKVDIESNKLEFWSGGDRGYSQHNKKESNVGEQTVTCFEVFEDSYLGHFKYGKMIKELERYWNKYLSVTFDKDKLMFLEIKEIRTEKKEGWLEVYLVMNTFIGGVWSKNQTHTDQWLIVYECETQKQFWGKFTFTLDFFNKSHRLAIGNNEIMWSDAPLLFSSYTVDNNALPNAGDGTVLYLDNNFTPEKQKF